MKKILVLLLPLLVFTCERDDICAESTPTTPRLVVAFLDLSNSDNPKNVTNFLLEYVEGSTRFLSETSTINSITLPLKTTENSTEFIFYKDYEIDDSNNQLGNGDTIIIEYAREEIYVSRACGYKTIYKNVEINVVPDGNNWIQLIQAINDNQTIENEETTHFNLLH